MSQVPVLCHKEKSLTQSLAIIHYLDQLNSSNSSLFPNSQCIELCELIGSGIQPLQNLAVLKELKANFSATEEQVQAWSAHWIKRGLNSFESKCHPDGPYSLGESFSAADCFLLPQIYNAKRFKLKSQLWPKIHKIVEKIKSEDIFSSAHPENQSDAQ